MARQERLNIDKILVLLFTLGISVISSYWTNEAWAGNNGYFTTYNSDIESGELELMFMTDLTAPSSSKREEDAIGNYFSHMIELEYGITDQLASEIMIEWFEDLESAKIKYTGFRWEGRYRLFKEKAPLNPMIYFEYEDLDPATRFKMEVSGWVHPPYVEKDGESDRERILESRFIISDDVGSLNWAVNWINETDTSHDLTAFGYSIGLMWMNSRDAEASSVMNSSMSMNHDHAGIKTCRCASEMEGCKCTHCRGLSDSCPCAHGGMVKLGIEIYGALGDTKAFRFEPSRQEHYLAPTLMYHINSHWMFHTQLAIGLSRTSDELFRLNFGYEF